MTEDETRAASARNGEEGVAHTPSDEASIPRTPDVEGIPDFWERVRDADDRCLVLDFDGTIAEFEVERMAARPLPGVVDLLIQIRDRTETYLAMMTGRPISELLALMGDLLLPISGSQGTEFRMPDGSYQTHLPSDRQEERFRRAEAEARALTTAGRLERKIASIGLHTRGVDPAVARREEEAVCRAWSADASEYDLECRAFKGGVELRLLDIDKGTALEALLRDRPADGLCVYVGDDLTDEDAFRALAGRGLSIKVGGPDDPTCALGRLPDPTAVKEFLGTWLEITTEN
ncbi:MAG: trehalose-phosphatase [Candidatus Eisenbacteria bacterium]